MALRVSSWFKRKVILFSVKSYLMQSSIIGAVFLLFVSGLWLKILSVRDWVMHLLIYSYRVLESSMIYHMLYPIQKLQSKVSKVSSSRCLPGPLNLDEVFKCLNGLSPDIVNNICKLR